MRVLRATRTGLRFGLCLALLAGGVARAGDTACPEGGTYPAFYDDPAPFEARLREAGFYAEWKGKYGDEAWAILEKAVGRTLA